MGLYFISSGISGTETVLLVGQDLKSPQEMSIVSIFLGLFLQIDFKSMYFFKGL